ncbi:MAG: hypothetical protein ABIA04_06165 [Pseudomonadota bacterium]
MLNSCKIFIVVMAIPSLFLVVSCGNLEELSNLEIAVNSNVENSDLDDSLDNEGAPVQETEGDVSPVEEVIFEEPDTDENPQTNINEEAPSEEVEEPEEEIEESEVTEDQADEAEEYDSIAVVPGVYYENIIMGDVSVELLSTEGAENTIIDGRSLGSVIEINTYDYAIYEDEALYFLISGFTIQNGYIESSVMSSLQCRIKCDTNFFIINTRRIDREEIYYNLNGRGTRNLGITDHSRPT